MGHVFFEVVSRERFEELMRSFPLLDSETMPLKNCYGRILAQNLIAPEHLPALDRSCMDGFAVSARDVFGASGEMAVYLELVGEVVIDQTPDFALSPGTCSRIPTGGTLPKGADAVVMIEQTNEMSGTVEVRKSLAPGDNVMFQGEDVFIGDLVLEAGQILRVPEIGLLAALGLLEVSVRRRVRVDIFSTGNEVVPMNVRPRPGQVRDVNSLTLACLAQNVGAEANIRGIMPDRMEILQLALLESLTASDCILLSGGSSVGIHDLTVSALKSLPEAVVLAKGVALSPGKPTILAKVGGKPIIGLPGQVTSAQVVMLALVQPFLRYLMGDTRAFDRSRWIMRRAELARNLASSPGREDYVRVRLEEREDKPPLAHPLLGKSGLLKTMLQAQGLIVVPADIEGLYSGVAVDVWLI